MNMSTTTNTPRTDAAKFFSSVCPPEYAVAADFARTLERELSSAQAELAEAKADLKQMGTVAAERLEWHTQSRRERDQLRARVAEALKHVSVVADSLNSNDPKHRPYKDSIEVVCTALKAKEILSNE